MNDMLLETICDGDLEELKKIPKVKLTNQIMKKLIDTFELKLKELKIHINNIECEDSEMKFLTCGYKDKRKNMEKCIEYLQKIK
jgi:histidyl-tRNA synthetase